MNPILMDVVLDYALFLDLSGDDIIGPDIAIRLMEQLAARLQILAPDDRAIFLHHVKERALIEQRIAGFDERVHRMMMFGEAYGLTE